MSRIKICGISRIQDIYAVNETLPDYIGFVFAKSRRQIDARQADKLKQKLDTRICSVGVFVDAPQQEIVSLCKDGIIEAVQLHGREDASYLTQLRDMISAPVIKAVRVKTSQQLHDTNTLNCDYLLFDAYDAQNAGGSGKRFDWSLIPHIDKPYFLAGGINTENIRQAIALAPYCVDISSGAEADGYKDKRKITELVGIARSIK